MKIFEFLQRRKVRKSFEPYLSPEVVRRLLNNPEHLLPKVKHFQFVVVLLDEANPQEISALVGGVVRTLFEHQATVTTVSLSIVVGLMGVPFPGSDSPEVRRAVVEALLRENGERIRIAHGECDAAVGNFGGPMRFVYDAAIPGFLGILKNLLEAEPGSEVAVS